MTLDFAPVPISGMRPEALEKRRKTAPPSRAAISSGRKALRMSSNGNNYTRIADGVRHVHEAIADGHAHTPRRFVGGATLRRTGLLVLAVLAALALASGTERKRQCSSERLPTSGAWVLPRSPTPVRRWSTETLA